MGLFDGIEGPHQKNHNHVVSRDASLRLSKTQSFDGLEQRYMKNTRIFPVIRVIFGSVVALACVSTRAGRLYLKILN